MEQENKHTITDEIFKKLESEKVTPIARWHFVLRNSTFWALWGLSVAIGACASAATIFVFFNAGWQYQAITHDSLFRFLLDTLPLFWLVAIGLMVFFGCYNIRHTNRGYRFSVYLVMAASIIASFVGGTILYTLGIAGDIDNFKKPLPFAPPLSLKEEDRWNNTTKGLLSGFVVAFDKEAQVLTIMVVSGEERKISTRELQDKDTALLIENSHVRIIGGFDIDANNELFVACAVLPWQPKGIEPKINEMNPQMQLLPERKKEVVRTSICKDVRPYQRYKETVITN